MKTYLYRVITLFLFMAGLISASGNATSLKFERITPQEGLSHNIVYGALQDQQGFLWFATQDGLNRYDGYEFRKFQHDPLDAQSIPESDLRVLLQNKSGQFWLGTWGGGLLRYNPVDDSFQQFRAGLTSATTADDDAKKAGQNASGSDLCGNRIQVLLEDDQDRLWIGAEDGGLCRLASGAFKTFDGLPSGTVQALAIGPDGFLWIGTSLGLARLDLKSETVSLVEIKLPIADVRALCWDSTGKLWIGTAQGAVIYDPATKFTQPASNENNTRAAVHVVYEDTAKNIWLGAEAGLLRFQRETGLWHEFMNDPTDPNSLSHNDVRCIFEDRAGVLWIGTRGGGLNKCDLKPRKFRHYMALPGRDNTLSDNRVNALWVDQVSAIWIGTDNGLNKLDQNFGSLLIRSGERAAGERFTVFTHQAFNPGSLCGERVLSLCEDQSGVLWVGTNRGLCRLMDRSRGSFRRLFGGEKNEYDPINTMREDSGGRIWLGTDRGLIAFDPYAEIFTPIMADLTKPTGLSSNRIRAIYPDLAGNLWIGTDDNGLNCLKLPSGDQPLNPAEAVFIRFQSNPQNQNSLSHNRVLSITQDKSGNLWIGTAGGLNLLTPAEIAKNEAAAFKRFTVKDGLPSNTIYGILEDESGRLWLSTNNGLARFNTANSSSRNYGISDGLQSNTFNTGAFHLSANGEMYFGGINGFNRFYPKQVKDNPHLPPIQLTAFKIFDELQKFQDNIELSYKRNFFSFEFAALDFTQPERNRYKYQMEGLSDDWIDAGARRFVNFPNLPGGNYTFRVKGSNNDGLWNEEGVAIHVRVIPPFWQTIWFKLLLWLTGFGVVLLALWLQNKRLERQKHEELRKKHEELQALKLEMQEKDLEAARAIQLSMVPTRFPNVRNLEMAARMEAAKHVGGDYYDMILSPDHKHVYIAIADVSGKGVPASLMMVEVRTIIHTLTSQHLGTDSMICQTNVHVYEDANNMDMPVMVTMLLMKWDIEQETLTYSGAGHEHILIYRCLDKSIEAHKVGGLWLGVEEDLSDYVNLKTIDLKTGDTILLYTDGVTEFHDLQQSLYGLDALKDFLQANGHRPVSEIVDTLFKTLREFGQGAEPHDDTTVLVFRKK